MQETTPIDHSAEATVRPELGPEITLHETPVEPEEEPLNYEQWLIDEIKELVDRDDARAAERYKGAFGSKTLGEINQFFNRVGERFYTEKEDGSIELDTLGEWEKTPRYRKWMGILSKVSGGLGTATVMVMSGAGVFTAPLWSKGLQVGIDGLIQVVEEVGWGNKRTNLELAAQNELTEAIEVAKLALREHGAEMTDDNFADLIIGIKEKENAVIEAQQKNMKSEQNWKLGRGIVSSVATLATGLLNGIPLGFHKAAEATKVGQVALDAGHRVVWNMHGGHFIYNNMSEYARASAEAIQMGAKLTIEPFVDEIGHVLGRGLEFKDWAQIASAFGILGAKIFGSKPRKPAEGENSPWKLNDLPQPAVAPVPVSSPELPATPAAPSVFESPAIPSEPAESAPEPVLPPSAPIIEASGSGGVGAGSASILEPTERAERSMETISGSMSLDHLRQEIKAAKGAWNFIKRISLQNQYEKIASDLMQKEIDAAGGWYEGKFVPKTAMENFCEIAGLSEGLFVPNRIKLPPNKGKVDIKMNWNLM